MIYIFFLEPVSAVTKTMMPEIVDEGIHETADIANADVIVSSSVENLLAQPILPRQSRLLWTNEPRWSSHVKHTEYLDSKCMHIMNAFTGNVYVDPFHFLWVTKFETIDLMTGEDYDKRKEAQSSLAYCMATYYGNGEPFIVREENLDLVQLRHDFALYAADRKLCDIYGSGWPEGVSKSSGRQGRAWKNWEDEKFETAKSYLFNVCIENTNSENLVTEKFWHALMTQCIPVYCLGRTNVDSFVDATAIVDCNKDREFSDVENEILSMSKDNYLDRINSLIVDVNKIIKNVDAFKNTRSIMIHNFTERLKSITEGSLGKVG